MIHQPIQPCELQFASHLSLMTPAVCWWLALWGLQCSGLGCQVTKACMDSSV